MNKFPVFRNPFGPVFTTDPGKVLHVLGAYIVPAAIALLSALAMLSWDNHYSVESGPAVSFRIIKQTADELSPDTAKKLLSASSPVRRYDTRLSESPFWLTFTTTPNIDGAATAIELPSRHARELTCWDAATLAKLGEASREQATGIAYQTRAGYALNVAQSSGPVSLLCRAVFSGPARIVITEWRVEELQAAARAFDRMSGLLDGGLVVLSMFVLVTGLINRESTYILFAVWLLANLRMAGLSSGWDVQWLGRTVPYEWLPYARSLTMALYYTLTATLFRNLFRDELASVGYERLLRITLWSCFPVLLAAVVLPYRYFLPLIWCCTGAGILVVVFFLVKILRLTRSPVAVWYSASLGVTLVASLYEVLSAAVGFQGLIGTINSVTAALSSSLLAALAIAAQLRLKHEKWIEAQAELQHTYEAMPIGLFTLSTTGYFISTNPAMLDMLGVKHIQIGQDSWDRFFNEGAWPHLHRLVHAQGSSELEIRCNADTGNEQKRFLVRAILARGKIEGSLQDITERSKATEDLQFMANNDPLTKVLNRRGIDTVMELAIIAIPAGIPFTLAYLDLDRFKLINDLYGHSAGDEILKQVCERISAKLSGAHRIGRVGGDEFLIAFPGTPASAAAWICRGIVDDIGTVPFRIADKAFQVRASVGLIEVSANTKIKDAISTADQACRAAKSANDGLVVYEKNASAFREREAELKLVERLAGGTAPHGLFIDMQPIMSLKNPHASMNFEVLLRMREPDGSVIPAGKLIAAAESSGKVGIIDRWVLSTVLSWLNTHLAELDSTQFVCMNLSGASLNDERFVHDVFDMLERNRRAAGLLCLEITESVALHDLQNTRRFIDQVRSCGVRIALDDFGAGYTSFSYLKDLPADVLKIDGSFIVDMNSHPANVAIVEAIVSLATNLGMKTIAEWAEDNATVQTLVEVGVDYVQGYAVSRPQSPERILLADSAANFIQDPELLAYVRSLSAASDALLGLPPVGLAASN